MRSIRVFLVLLLGVLLFGPGCANLTSLDRSTDLAGVEGKNKSIAIHLDAKQRLVIADVVSDKQIICAEPSPDALSAVASSLGGGITVGTGQAASVAQALQESSANIGLRTQSITLMRDTLYRICEAYHNKAINETDLIQLLQRSQDLTLGVLAIEQLTGAVAARQVALTGGANASAAANLSNTQVTLDNARRYEASRKKEFEVAEEKKKSQKTLIEKTKTDIAAAKEAKNDAEVQRLTKLKVEQEEQLELDKKAAEEAKETYERAKKVTEKIEENLNSAFTAATAAASGSSEFAAAVDRDKLNNESAKAVAEAVDRIVARVVNKGHWTDTCINLFAKYAATDQKYDKHVMTRALAHCDMVIGAAIEVFKFQGIERFTLPSEGKPIKEPELVPLVQPALQ